MNNLEIFERFCLYFMNTARDHVLKACHDPLLKAWRSLSETDVLLTPHSDERALINDFIKSITPKRLFLIVDGREIYLTKREVECARLLVQGKTNKVISECLFISPRTVETHLESLRTKTDCSDRSELILFLIRSGLSRF